MNEQTPQLPSLVHDCAACSALCCVMIAFDADQGFGFDKEAGTPCQHLAADFSCGIHSSLKDAGFSGCVHYSCHGAGQRVTRAFGEANWKSSPELALEVHAVFARMRKLHELQFLLHTARSKVDDTVWQQRLLQQQQQIELMCIQAEAGESVDQQAATTNTYALLRQLATEPAIVALRQAGTL